MKKRYWLDAEKDELLRLRDERRLDWPAIAARLPGRTPGACQIQYYARLRDRAQARRYSQTRLLPPQRISLPVVVTAPAVTPQRILAPDAVPARLASLDALRTDAELRARIAERGLTGGVFGDPPPGRSALDARLQGRQAPLQPSLAGEVSDVG